MPTDGATPTANAPTPVPPPYSFPLAWHAAATGAPAVGGFAIASSTPWIGYLYAMLQASASGSGAAPKFKTVEGGQHLQIDGLIAVVGTTLVTAAVPPYQGCGAAAKPGRVGVLILRNGVSFAMPTGSQQPITYYFTSADGRATWHQMNTPDPTATNLTFGRSAGRSTIYAVTTVLSASTESSQTIASLCSLPVACPCSYRPAQPTAPRLAARPPGPGRVTHLSAA